MYHLQALNLRLRIMSKPIHRQTDFEGFFFQISFLFINQISTAVTRRMGGTSPKFIYCGFSTTL